MALLSFSQLKNFFARSIAFYPQLELEHATQLYQLRLHPHIFGFVVINSQLPKCIKTRVKSHTTWEGFDVGIDTGGGEGTCVVCPGGRRPLV